jgi:hypothetical protein
VLVVGDLDLDNVTADFGFNGELPRVDEGVVRALVMALDKPSDDCTDQYRYQDDADAAGNEGMIV